MKMFLQQLSDAKAAVSLLEILKAEVDGLGLEVSCNEENHTFFSIGRSRGGDWHPDILCVAEYDVCMGWINGYKAALEISKKPIRRP